MKKCIWCNRTELNTSFKTLAHTIPQSLGGVAICKNVCDECNHYFGRTQNQLPSIETVLKETFILSRYRFLNGSNEIGKNKIMPKFSSQYFNINTKNNKLDVKLSYQLKKGFQENVCRLLKRGLYKIFLEENERENLNSHNDNYNFIREFARYNLGDYPVFYFERNAGIFISSDNFFRNPHMMFSMKTMNYLIRDHGFYEFEFYGHTLSLATSKLWHLELENYLKKSMFEKKQFYKSYKLINRWNDIDLSLHILDK